jgi:flagellin-like protein
MKKIWKKRKNSEAVSPVIATILMVAITVVLAAVLYVMVMGFGTTGNQTPTGAFTSATKLTATTYKIQFGAVSPDTQFQACKIRVDPAATPTTAVTFSLSGTTTLTITPAAATGTAPGIAITDLAADGKISVGDYVTVTLDTNHPATDNGDWIITLLFTATGGSIASKTFTVSGN